MTTSAPDQERTSVVSDVFKGALLGDFSKRLGPAGALTQIVIGYLPVAGTITAARDLLADVAAGDGLGVFLNLIAMFPVLGGIAKTAEVLHHLRRLRRSLQGLTTHPVVPDEEVAQQGGRGPNLYSLTSVLIGVLAPFLSAGLSIYGLVSLAPLLGWSTTDQRTAVLVVATLIPPVLGIIFGHVGSRRARRMHGSHSPRPMARIGLALGYIYLVAVAVAIALVVSSHLIK
jgi:hypothetical protein